MPEKKFKFKLGSDPEFSFILQGRRVTAAELLCNNLSRKKGFTKKDQGFDCTGGQIGWDGCSATAELRPKPSNSVEEITSNIKSILTETYKHLPMFDMSVISTHAPVGGHIHFQIPENLADNDQKKALLHKKISSFFLPIMISENKVNLRLRTKAHGYGTLTDFHGDNKYKQPDGTTEYTYEFRTPSAEWLTTEKICNATFAYMGVIYNEIMNKPENFNKYLGIVYKNNEQAKSLHQLIITDYIGITESLFNQVKKAIRTFELYPDFKEQVEYILNPKKVVTDKRKANYNIVEGWKLGKSSMLKTPTFKDITNDKKFKAQAEKINLDQMASLINISYNDDINVEYFVKILSERSIAFNWKLKNNYFIFGLKKGIDDAIVFNQKEELLKGQENVKTTGDEMAMKELMKKIFKKFTNANTKVINPITGDIEKANVIVIGLPYGMRINKKHKEFIKLIYSLEGNRIRPVTTCPSRKELINDNNKPDTEKGMLFKYLFNIPMNTEQNKQEVPGVTFDTSSQGARFSQEANQAIIDEEIRDERENQEPQITAQELTEGMMATMAGTNTTTRLTPETMYRTFIEPGTIRELDSMIITDEVNSDN